MRQPPSKILSSAMKRQMNQIDAEVCYLGALRSGTTILDLIPVGEETQLDQLAHDRWYKAMDEAFDDLYKEIKQGGAEKLKSLISSKRFPRAGLNRLAMAIITAIG